MKQTDALQPDLLPDDDAAQKAMSRFHLRCGQAQQAADAHTDYETMYLFPLVLILECEGMLAGERA